MSKVRQIDIAFQINPDAVYHGAILERGYLLVVRQENEDGSWEATLVDLDGNTEDVHYNPHHVRWMKDELVRMPKIGETVTTPWGYTVTCTGYAGEMDEASERAKGLGLGEIGFSCLFNAWVATNTSRR